MNKIDRNKQMIEEIKNLNYRPKLLLHSCCAPCSSSVLERLVEFFDITIFFYNPNIDKDEEFKKRQDEEIRLINELNIKYSKNKIKIVTTNHNSDDYNKIVLGLENEKEGGKRCEKCFFLRLSETAKFAKQNNFDYAGFIGKQSSHKYRQSRVFAAAYFHRSLQFASAVNYKFIHVSSLKSVFGGKKVNFIQSDVFENISGEFDFIISNPPYIPTDVIATLSPEVRNEPRLALDGGPDGLDVIRKIISSAPAYLKPGETGPHLFDQIVRHFRLKFAPGFNR